MNLAFHSPRSSRAASSVISAQFYRTNFDEHDLSRLNRLRRPRNKDGLLRLDTVVLGLMVPSTADDKLVRSLFPVFERRRTESPCQARSGMGDTEAGFVMFSL